MCKSIFCTFVRFLKRINLIIYLLIENNKMQFIENH